MIPGKKLLNLSIIFMTATMLVSCGSEEEQPDQLMEIKSDSTKSNLVNIEGQVFSLPSPIQTAMLIQKSGAPYDASLLNEAKNVSKYTTNFQKALNLGILGADLAYVTIYQQTQNGITYLTAVNKLAEELGVSGAFSQDLIKRFERNMGNQDSLLVMVSDAYQEADNFLKNNKRKDVSALVLTGGWIESLWFAVNVAEKTKNKDVIQRIGEQKITIKNLKKLLEPFYKEKPEYAELIDQLIDLETVFDQIVYTYEYVEPTHDVANRVTTINSKTTVTINDEQLRSITEKIKLIRNKIIS